MYRPDQAEIGLMKNQLDPWGPRGRPTLQDLRHLFKFHRVPQTTGAILERLFPKFEKLRRERENDGS
jgi:hypothetical protein